MKKILFRKILLDSIVFFFISLLSASIIIWVFQAVNFLDIMVEDGRDYLVYVQMMSYLAHKEGHSKTSIGKFLKRNHATVINSCTMIENGYFTNDKKVMDAHNNIIKHLEKYVGTISEDTESKPDSKPELDPIWYEAKNLLTRGNSKG